VPPRPWASGRTSLEGPYPNAMVVVWCCGAAAHRRRVLYIYRCILILYRVIAPCAFSLCLCTGLHTSYEYAKSKKNHIRYTYTIIVTIYIYTRTPPPPILPKHNEGSDDNDRPLDRPFTYRARLSPPLPVRRSALPARTQRNTLLDLHA